jgi:hypothetical protein
MKRPSVSPTEPGEVVPHIPGGIDAPRTLLDELMDGCKARGQSSVSDGVRQACTAIVKNWSDNGLATFNDLYGILDSLEPQARQQQAALLIAETTVKPLQKPIVQRGLFALTDNVANLLLLAEHETKQKVAISNREKDQECVQARLKLACNPRTITLEPSKDHGGKHVLRFVCDCNQCKGKPHSYIICGLSLDKARGVQAHYAPGKRARTSSSADAAIAAESSDSAGASATTGPAPAAAAAHAAAAAPAVIDATPARAASPHLPASAVDSSPRTSPDDASLGVDSGQPFQSGRR